MKPGSQILCADGSIVMEVISADPKAGTVRAKCMNNATLGYAPMRAPDAGSGPTWRYCQAEVVLKPSVSAQMTTQQPTHTCFPGVFCAGLLKSN